MSKKDKVKKMKKELLKEFNKYHKLESAMEAFRVALESSPIPLLVHTEDGEFLIMSDSCMQQTGYDKEEIDTLPKWINKLHPNREKYNQDFVNDIFEEGVSVQGDVEQVVTKSGDIKFWAFHNTLIGTLSDHRKTLMTLCVDLTKEYEAQAKAKDLLAQLERSETLLKASMESQDTVVLIDKEFNYLYFNSNHKENIQRKYGVDVEIGQNVFEGIEMKEDSLKERTRYNRALKGESFTEIDIYGDNQDFYYQSKYSPLKMNEQIIGLSIFTTNITERMKETKRVRESEEKFRLIYSTMSQGLAIHEIICDDDGVPVDYRCIEINDSYLKLFNLRKEDIVGKRIKTIAPKLEDYWIDLFGTVALTGEPKYYENYSSTIDKYLSVYTYSPRYKQFAVLISDITDRIKREKEIKYLSYNDQLTGLFNRRFYDEKMVELDDEKFYPLSLIVGDVNGLKLVNDSFGHQVGDELLRKVADILRQSCRNTDIITRIGGDEFVVFLPNTDFNQTKHVIDRINRYSQAETIESIEVSVSFGYNTKKDKSESLSQIFKIAEDEMYRNKLSDSRSMRSRTIDLIMTTLFEKNDRESFHSKRVGLYCERIAKALGLDNSMVNMIKNAGMMHDIGKIGISDHILNKSGKLTFEEYDEIKKHSEIGYRILSSIPEFSDIASYILQHHERNDGLGYPNGLMGNEILLQAKIINVADSYDAMTSVRPYKDALTKKQAIDELKKFAGTQFDQEVVDVFITEVLTKNN